MSKKIHGYLFYDALVLDNDGHCDDPDLMFVDALTGTELCLSGLEEQIEESQMSTSEKKEVYLTIQEVKLEVNPSSPQVCTEDNPCCERRGEYNGFGSGPLKFLCPKHCPCHD